MQSTLFFFNEEDNYMMQSSYNNKKIGIGAEQQTKESESRIFWPKHSMIATSERKSYDLS